MNTSKIIDGQFNRQYHLDNTKRTIKFPFKGEMITVDLSDPESSKHFMAGGKEYYLLIEWRGFNKTPKFYIIQEDRDKDKKLHEGIVKGNWDYLENSYYGNIIPKN